MDALDGVERVTETTDPPSVGLSNAVIVKRIACILAAVILALLVPIPLHGRTASALGDLVHAPLFGSLAFAWITFWQRRISLAQQPSADGSKLIFRTAVVWITLSSFGVVMELAQWKMGRSMALHDAIANSLGVAAALAIFHGIQLRRSQRNGAAKTAFVGGLLLLAAAWVHPAIDLSDDLAIMYQFPLLASFETETELSRWYRRDCELVLSSEHVTAGEHSGQVTFRRSHFPAVTLIELVHDWRQYSELQLDLLLDPDTAIDQVTAVLKIVDQSGQFGEAKFVQNLSPGQPFRWTINKQQLDALEENGLNRSQIRFIDLGLVDPPVDVKIWIDNVRLLP
ncbi:hypothetical protein [Rhodopirellula sp. MGV]|uniref:hypothetical protein n=1 Tax=Rhodopirellula sp. MGV TaxID=2023130 RepID=UPI000B96F8BA|nr:hypothetical protein [Rhodopirellula sp. MGV]OYP34755.1 hypothetical protein CGZ80_14095 [Rhodopirellula sp. MGV]PNY34291.1 hypothetical protein C2E31_23960 [Rhodopirellula baltica]